MDEETKRRNLEVYQGLVQALTTLQDKKPNDRSEADRHWAILVTDVEKAVTLFHAWFVYRE